MEVKAKVGEEVLFHSQDPDRQSLKATVVKVNEDDTIDVVYEHAGKRYEEKSVELVKGPGSYAALAVDGDWPEGMKPTPKDKIAAEKAYVANAEADEKARLDALKK